MTGEFIGNKIADKIVKPKPVSDENLRDAEEIIIPSEKKKRRSTKQIKKIIIKLQHHKVSTLLNNSTVSKFLTRRWIEVTG